MRQVRPPDSSTTARKDSGFRPHRIVSWFWKLNENARRLIDRLELSPLPLEGGFFRRTWTSTAKSGGGRPAGSVIYFLLTPDDFSALHRLATDEIWFYHGGDCIDHVQLLPSRLEPIRTRLGPNALAGEVPQLVVPGGAWQGALLASKVKQGWALCSCMMTPAWDEREFELGNPAHLRRDFPRAVAWIAALTR